VLPGVAAQLGLDEELREARAMAVWQRIVEERVPAAADASRIVAIRPPVVLVSVADPATGQELRLRSAELLEAFAGAPGGQRLKELRVTIGGAPRGNRGAPR
jgi:predicted nucleic acid-binding Zn ribbon protein